MPVLAKCVQFIPRIHTSDEISERKAVREDKGYALIKIHSNYSFFQHCNGKLRTRRNQHLQTAYCFTNFLETVYPSGQDKSVSMSD